MTKDEVLWGNIRFLLLLIFSVAAIYIILCRYILNVPTEDIDSSSALLHWRQMMSCNVGISLSIRSTAFCCFSIREGNLLNAPCGYCADSTKPSGSAPLRPHRYFNPLIPSTKNVLRSNVPSMLYSLRTNKFSPAYVPTVPYASLR